MLSLQKIEKISSLAFYNALRLHNDSIALYKDKRYPSAFYLSILSQEELGKMYIAIDFVWHSLVDGREPEHDEEWLGLLYRHPHKQGSFLRSSPLIKQWSPRGVALMQGVFDGALEVKKQGAVYVGLNRYKGKIDTNGKIRHPFQISKIVAKNQITKINDHLLVTGIGVKFTYYSLDHEGIEYVLKNKRFLKYIFKDWKDMSKSAITRIRMMQKHSGEKIISI